MQSFGPSQAQTREASEAGSESALQLVSLGSINSKALNESSALRMSQNGFGIDPTCDIHFIVMKPLTALEAFTCIATILSLTCTQESGFNINVDFSTLPPPIQPTSQQQIVPHKAYVDMMPWSSMRDRLLNSLSVINEQEFVTDMLKMKVWGVTPWDPTGWELSPEFAKKWWFLIDNGMLRTTNFWRSQRGEEALVLAPF